MLRSGAGREKPSSCGKGRVCCGIAACPGSFDKARRDSRVAFRIDSGSVVCEDDRARGSRKSIASELQGTPPTPFRRGSQLTGSRALASGLFSCRTLGTPSNVRHALARRAQHRFHAARTRPSSRCWPPANWGSVRFVRTRSNDRSYLVGHLSCLPLLDPCKARANAPGGREADVPNGLLLLSIQEVPINDFRPKWPEMCEAENLLHRL